MANIVCSYDTVSKEMSVTIDGKTMDNVSEFRCCEYGMSVVQSSEDVDNGMRTQIYTMAKENPEAPEFAKASEVDGYVKFNGKPAIINDVFKILMKSPRK